MRRIPLFLVSAVAWFSVAASPAAASLPRAISEHIADVAQWAYRGGTTRTFPSCESACSSLWTAEHAPSASDPFAVALWAQMETLRERVEVLPAIGTMLPERELSFESSRRIGIETGQSPGHVIWMELVLPPAIPWTVLARSAAEPTKYVVRYYLAGVTLSGARLAKGGWIIGGRYGTVLAQEFQELCGPGMGNVGYVPPVGHALMAASGTAGCALGALESRSPLKLYELGNPVATPSEDYTSQRTSETATYLLSIADPGQRTVQERITRQLELDAEDYPLLIRWLDHHLGGPSDDPVDMEAALLRHEPLYRFDSGEDFLPQVAESFTDNYVLDSEGHYALEDANQLNTGTSTLRAAAGSPGTGTLPQPLRLELLGANYHDGTNEPSASEDNINARGNEVSTYESDAERMWEAGYRGVVYGRAVTAPEDGRVWLQYWVFYYDNSWGAPIFEWGQHEGDWEMIQVGLNEADEPDAVTFARHATSDTWGCTWEQVEKTGGSEEAPVVYPGRGSHASYPHAGETELVLGQTDYHHGDGTAEQPPLHMLTAEDDWMNWKGRWGASTGEFESPHTPSQQGQKWSNPSRFQSEHLDSTHCER
jgi:hypothetical protein